MKSILLSISILFLFLSVIHAQQTSNIEQPISIDSTGAEPDTSAMLDVVSSSRGVLIPRMSTGARNAIVLPARGLLVYDTTMNALCHYSGSTWNCHTTSCQTLDMAYDCGGPAMGRTILVDTGAVNLFGTAATTPTLTASASSASSTIDVVQFGTGDVISAFQANPFSAANTISAINDGFGQSVYAATFNPTNPAATVKSEQFGLGHAGHFETFDLMDTVASVKSEHFGGGDGVHGIANTVDTFGRAGVVGTGMGDASTAAALHAHNGAIRVSKSTSPNTPADKIDTLLSSWLPMDDCPSACGGTGTGGDTHAWNSDVIFVPNVYVDPVRSVIVHTVECNPPNLGIKAITKMLVPGGFFVQFVVDTDNCTGFCFPGALPVTLHYIIINK